MQMKLTDRNLAKVTVPSKGEPAIRITDTKIPGFYCRVSSKPPHIYFYAKADFKGSTKTVKITDHLGIIKARDARRQVGAIKARIATGEYHKQRATLVTLREARDRRVRMIKRSPATVRMYTTEFDRFFGDSFDKRLDWMHKPLCGITRQDVQNRHQYITDNHGPTQADRAMRALRAVYRYAIRTYDEAQLGGSYRPPTEALYGQWNNPAPAHPEWLHEDFKAIWAAIDTVPNIDHQTWLRLLFITGLRPGQGKLLQWQHLDFDAAIIAIPGDQTKNREPLLQPISKYAYDLLIKQQRRVSAKYPGKNLAKEVRYVFPTYSRKKPGYIAPLSSPAKSYGLLAAAVGKRFKPHDCRHFFNEIAHGLEIETSIRKALLNHKDFDITNSTYLRRNVERLRRPIELITNKMLQMAGRDGVVVPFSSKTG